MPALSGMFKRYVVGFLALALLGAFWTTALTRVSEKQNATILLTDIGTEVLNPLLLAHGSGLSQSTYTQLVQLATANPGQPLSIAFVKPTVLGREIVGKDFAAGSAVIYGHVADAYYHGGPGDAFSLPSDLQQLVSTYLPFVQNPTAALSNGQTSSPVPQLPIPQLPSFAEPFYAAVGISPTTLTSSGHDFEATWSQRFWLASLVLGALLALFSTGWARLSGVAWAVFHGAWHITSLMLIAAFLISRNATLAAPYKGILGIVGGAFFPVYIGATVGGLLGVGISKLGPVLVRGGGAKPGAETAPAGVPAGVRAGVPAGVPLAPPAAPPAAPLVAGFSLPMEPPAYSPPSTPADRLPPDTPPAEPSGGPTS